MRTLLLDRFTDTGHFAGVPAALHALGASFERWLQEPAAPGHIDAFDVVALAECLSPRAGATLRAARAAGVPSLLLMDGLCEWRNTYRNPAAGPAFLRPAPVDAIACAGPLDAAILRALGNHALATGLPRLARCVPLPEAQRPRLLVATARRAYFDDDERARLLTALERVRGAAERMGIPISWRVTSGLDAALGVEPDTCSLHESLADCSAVLTTPSTLLVEAMLAGRPAALLHPFDTPLWQPSAWVWRDGAEHENDWTAYAPPAPELRVERFTSERVSDLLESLLRPTDADLRSQAACLALLHTASPAPADGVARAALETARAGVRARRPAPAPIARACALKPGAAAPAVRILLRDAGQRVDAGAVPGAHTLVVAVSPRSAFDHGVEIDPAANASVCVVDPALGLDEAFKVVRASIEALGAKSLELGGDELSQRLAAWADAAGLRVGSLAGERADGLALDWGGQPVAGSAAARLLDAVRAARRGGCERIAVYGLGRNTHRAARALAGMPIVGFIDDDAEPGEMFLGLPVATAQRAMSMLRPDAVVLSSEAHATAMAARCAHLARAGVRIEALCEPAQALERTPC